MKAVYGRNMLREERGIILTCNVDGNIMHEINIVLTVLTRVIVHSFRRIV
jgi:hypothetical protein